MQKGPQEVGAELNPDPPQHGSCTLNSIHKLFHGISKLTKNIQVRRNWPRPIPSKGLSDKRSKLSTLFQVLCPPRECGPCTFWSAAAGSPRPLSLELQAHLPGRVYCSKWFECPKEGTLLFHSSPSPDGLEKLRSAEEEHMGPCTTIPCHLEKCHSFLRLSPHL